MNKMKKGYKRTEIGVVPVDWEVSKLINICNKITDGTHDTPKPIKKGIPFLTAIHVKENNIAYDECYFLPVDVHKGIYARCNPEKNDVLMVNIGAGVGTTALVNVDYEFSLKNVALIKANRKELLGKYLNHILIFQKTKFINDFISGGAQPFLSLGQIGKIQIPLPPLPEQKAIAEVLSDTDNLIQALEKRIAKKRLIKQGAMQKLLTPKDDWEVKKLGDYLDYEQPTNYIVTDTEYNDNYDIPVLTAGKTFILGYTNETFGIFENLPVIIFDDFTTASKYVDFPFKTKSSAMKILKPKNETVNLRFVYEIMQEIDYPLGDHKRHWIGEFQHLEIKVPKLKEQTHIATILSDMDSEIQALEKKLAKYQQLKQGLMQNLLTGKIRLI